MQGFLGLGHTNDAAQLIGVGWVGGGRMTTFHGLGHTFLRADGGGGCFFNDVYRVESVACTWHRVRMRLQRGSLFRPLERTDFHC